MKKRKAITIKINLTNKWLYSLIALFIVVVLGLGVYALAPGVKPNPGHLISELAPPSGCVNGQALTWNGNSWECKSAGINSVIVTSASEEKEAEFNLQKGDQETFTFTFGDGYYPKDFKITCTSVYGLVPVPMFSGWQNIGWAEQINGCSVISSTANGKQMQITIYSPEGVRTGVITARGGIKTLL